MGMISPPRPVKLPLRSLTAAARTGPEVLVPGGVVLVLPVSPVPVAVVVVSELEAEGPELA